MTEVIWLSDDSLIPGHGMAITGEAITLSKSLADAYIKHGDAKASKKKIVRDSKEVDLCTDN